jgi:hypothetical protein
LILQPTPTRAPGWNLGKCAPTAHDVPQQVVASHAEEQSAGPLRADVVQVRMTGPAKANVDLNIVRTARGDRSATVQGACVHMDAIVIYTHVMLSRG